MNRLHQHTTMHEATSDATVTVTYEGESVTFALSGTELSWTPQPDGTIHAYLNNASRGFVADEIERALLKIVAAKMDQNGAKA